MIPPATGESRRLGSALRFIERRAPVLDRGRSLRHTRATDSCGAPRQDTDGWVTQDLLLTDRPSCPHLRIGALIGARIRAQNANTDDEYHLTSRAERRACPEAYRGDLPRSGTGSRVTTYRHALLRPRRLPGGRRSHSAPGCSTTATDFSAPLRTGFHIIEKPQ